jgi:hypothetical protein
VSLHVFAWITSHILYRWCIMLLFWFIIWYHSCIYQLVSIKQQSWWYRIPFVPLSSNHNHVNQSIIANRTMHWLVVSSLTRNQSHYHYILLFLIISFPSSHSFIASVLIKSSIIIMNHVVPWMPNPSSPLPTNHPWIIWSYITNRESIAKAHVIMIMNHSVIAVDV